MGPKDFLDPNRIAAAMSTSFLEIIPGFFHVTPISRIRNIIKQGLLPGTVMQHRRTMDIHAAIFGPNDSRGEANQRRITDFLRVDAQCAVVYIDAASVVNAGRVNLGDGVCLWSRYISVKHIHSIVAASYACGAQSKNVSGSLKYDLLFDNQFATIAGQRIVR